MKLRSLDSGSGHHRGGTVLQRFIARKIDLGGDGVQRFHQNAPVLLPEIVKSGLGRGQK